MLRPYQRDILESIPAEGNSLMVLPTGGGKTYTFTTYIKEQGLPTCVAAHRSELVGQMSLSLAHAGIYHRLVASDQTRASIMKAHRQVLGKCYFDPSAPTICSSVDTLIRRDSNRFKNIKQWVIDEAHHVLRENKWGKIVDKFPNARGLGVTATPMRADGKGLGRQADGVFDHLIEGPSGDDLIEWGYLSPYELIGPSVKDVDWSELERGKTGDYKQKQLAAATKNSRQLVGSIVETYLSCAKGKLGLTFCVDIEHAQHVTEQFEAAGVPVAMVSAKTPFLKRLRVMEDFKARRILMLVNVDLFGEGMDVPGVEVVIMARKTASFPLFSQQAGRAFRPVYAPGTPLDTVVQRRAAIAAGPKPIATIIDHVENWRQHLLPTARKNWSLEGGEKRGKSQGDNEFKLVPCKNVECAKPYRAILRKCPYCGQAPQPTSRKGTMPEEVDGELEKIDLDMVREMQARIEKVDAPVRIPAGLSRPAALKLAKDHNKRSLAQQSLRDMMAQWAGWKKHVEGLTTGEIQKYFYLKFKYDVLTAQTLGAKDAELLTEEIKKDVEQFERGVRAEQSPAGVHRGNGGHPVAQ